MEQLRGIKEYIPQRIFDGAIPIITLFSLNILLLNTCSFMGCYDINITNMFRMNMLCNACTDISYHLQNHQIKIYVFMGGYLLKRANEIIDGQIRNISPSKSWEKK